MVRPLPLLVVVVGCTCALVTLLAGGDREVEPPAGKGHEGARPPERSSPRGLGRELARIARAGSGEDLVADRGRERTAVLGAARRFLVVYLPYEVGGSSAGFAGAATRNFARTLRARPPRLPPGLNVPLAAADLQSLAVTQVGRTATVVASLRRSGTREATVLELVRRGTAWRVSGVAG